MTPKKALSPTRSTDLQPWLTAVIYTIAYLGLEWTCHVRPELTPGITPLNPQAGLTVAFLVTLGARWLAVPALTAGLAALLIRDVQAPWPLIAAASVWIAIGYAALSELLRRTASTTFVNSTTVAAKASGLCAVSIFVIAAGYVGIYVIAGEVSGGDAVRGVLRYWLADLNGVVALAPLLVNGGFAHAWPAVSKRWVEVFAQIFVLIVMLWTIFALPIIDQLRYFYLLFVPVIWIALRWHWPGALLTSLAIQIGLIAAAKAGIQTPRFIDIQLLVLTLSLTGLLLGSVVRERARVLHQVATRESEQRALLAMAPDAVLILNSQLSVTSMNPAGRELFGDRVNATNVEQLLPGLGLNTPHGRSNLQGARADGSLFPAEIAWAQLDPPANHGFLVTVRDATERHRSEEQLRDRDAALARAMRFAMAGELASALAHELNQPITALVSYLNASEILATRAVSQDQRLQTTLDKAAREALRASTVLSRLRNFFSGGERKHEQIDVLAMCSAVVTAFQDRLRRADAVLDLRVTDTITPILGDVIQLEIALHNLIANAIDAVSPCPRSKRLILLSVVQTDQSLLFVVEDSGPGVSDQVYSQLFEPFVTSKSDGMGLGIAISRTLVRARGGDLSYSRSTRLGGACFTIELPFLDPAEASLR